MSTLNPPQPSFEKLARVLRHQRWMMAANGFVTFAFLVVTFGALATFMS